MSENYSYELPEPNEESRRLAAGWLILGISALVAAGLLAILLVMARTPYIKDIFPWNNFFKTAMVVHVDLSVLAGISRQGGRRCTWRLLVRPSLWCRHLWAPANP